MRNIITLSSSARCHYAGAQDQVRELGVLAGSRLAMSAHWGTLYLDDTTEQDAMFFPALDDIS